MLDPYQTSRIPGAKPPKPDKPPKPRNLLLMTQKSNDSPEWLTFSEKKRRFEQGLQSKGTSETKSMEKSETYAESKRFSYLSPDELEKLKEEEAKKLASFSEDQIKSMMNPEDDDEDDDENFDQFISEETSELINSDNQRVFRTAKAERRYKERLKKSGFEMDLDFEEQLKNLTPNQRRALEAEKRALWRQARLKSLEDDAMVQARAQMVMAKVKEMNEQMEARPVSPKIQVIDIDIDVDNSNGIQIDSQKVFSFNYFN